MEPHPPSSEDESSSAESTFRPRGQRATADQLRDAISRAWDCGAEDARRTAREAIPRVRLAAAEFAADLAYGLGYGASFAATMLDQLGSKDAGFSSERGMAAGRKAAEALIRRFGRHHPVPPPARPEEGHPTT